MSAKPKPRKDLDHYLNVFKAAENAAEAAKELPFFVYCQRRSAVVEIAECEHCVYCDGITREGDERAVVTCRFAPRSAPRNTVPQAPLTGQMDDARRTEWPVFASAPLWLVMKTEYLTVPPELSIETLRELFLVKSVSAAAVVDDAGYPMGVVSKTDILQYDSNAELVPVENSDKAVARGFHEVSDAPSVFDIMTPFSFSLPPDASLARAAAFMAFEGIHSLLVVNDAGKLVGFVTSLDILAWLAREAGFNVDKPVG